MRRLTKILLTLRCSNKSTNKHCTMKHILLFLMLVLSASVSAADWDGRTVATAYAGGTGTETDPYLISNCEEFAYFAGQVAEPGYSRGKYFKLTRDLVFNDSVYARVNFRNTRLDKPDWPNVPAEYADKYKEWTQVPDSIRWLYYNLMPFVGKYSKDTDGPEVIVPFEGTFDGDGHVLRGVFQDRMQVYGAIFHAVENGTIKNLGIEDAYFVNNSQYGSFAGKLTNSRMINCYIRHSFIESGGSYGGGLVGNLSGDSRVENCFVSDCVVMGKNGVGGLIGRIGNNAKTIYHCVVSNCYADAFLKVKKTVGEDEHGAFAAWVIDSVEVKNCWYTMKGKSRVAVWKKYDFGQKSHFVKVNDEQLQSDTLLAALNANAKQIEGARQWVRGANGQPEFAPMTTGITQVNEAAKGAVSYSLYTVDGRQIWRGRNLPAAREHGLYILCTETTDGHSTARKVVF